MASVAVGRIIYTRQALTAVELVNFAVDQGGSAAHPDRAASNGLWPRGRVGEEVQRAVFESLIVGSAGKRAAVPSAYNAEFSAQRAIDAVVRDTTAVRSKKGLKVMASTPTSPSATTWYTVTRDGCWRPCRPAPTSWWSSRSTSE